MFRTSAIVASLAAAFLLASPLQAAAQTDPGLPFVAKAKELAGKDYAWTANMLCMRGEIVSSFFGGATMQGPDQDAPPVRVFDDLYYIGLRQVGMWVVRTSDGLILIDSLYPGMGESKVAGDMRHLGLDPAKIKYVILTHGHADHYGGARYFQERYGARVAMSAADWDYMAGQGGAPESKPKRDMVLQDGQVLTLGKTSLVAVLTPGHTPGSMALIIPVSDKGAPHVAGLWGGTMISAPVPLADRERYLSSVDHFLTFSRKAGVDVEIENHPYVGGQIAKMFTLSARKSGDPNPFVVGQGSFERYMGVLRTCAEAGIERAKVGLERTGRPARAAPAGAAQQAGE
jgi:metallo-beta-lactamase class B